MGSTPNFYVYLFLFLLFFSFFASSINIFSMRGFDLDIIFLWIFAFASVINIFNLRGFELDIIFYGFNFHLSSLQFSQILLNILDYIF